MALRLLGVMMILLGGACGLLAAPPATTATSRPRPATAPVLKPGQKYTPATDEEIQAVKDWADNEQKKVAKELGATLTTLETAHFEIITDWDPREHTFLKDNFEAAYAAVTKQFNIPVSENIFLGKLPCFVFTKYESFAKFLQNFQIPGVKPELQGIYIGGSLGWGFLAVHKPQADHGGERLDAAMLMWKYVLTHEMTHAFVARYISDRRVVTWLNEGIAEVVALGRFPRNQHAELLEAAGKYKNLDKLFADDGKFKSADLYPVMRTLTEVLVKKDHKAFMQMFDDIKAGKAPDEALEDNYHWTYAQLESIWRQYIK